MVLMDGRKLSQKILESLKGEVAVFGRKLRLAAVTVGENEVVEKFIGRKRKTAEELGIEMRVFSFQESASAGELRRRIGEIAREEKNTAVIVQLPLPAHVNKQYVLNSVPPHKDADMLSSRSVGNFITGRSAIFPPVAGAVKTILEEYKVPYKDKYFVLVGAGSLVGRPLALWFLREGITYSVLNSRTENPELFLKNGDIIVSGAGKPKFVKGDMIKEGAAVIDAGTSECEGRLVGDVDFDSVAPKASFITPVPGGIGPLTVAALFQNVFALARSRGRV